MRIGNIEIENPIALAPMEDVSDIPFRKICKRRGADILYTEFTNCEALIRNVERAHKKISIAPDESPIAVQLYGSNGDSLEAATEIAELAGPDFIDINCGCWVKKVAMRGDGAGLLRDLPKFERVVQSVMRSTRLPVTVKTRLGWDDDSIVILDVARMLRDNGVQALTVHCRTRKQAYTGTADWSWLPRIKEAVPELSLIANGDIDSAQAVEEVLNLGSDGAMIGRGAIHNPWIFQQIKHYRQTGEELPPPSIEDRFELCIEHLKAHVDYRGDRRGIPSFRKYYGHYISGLHKSSKVRVQLMELMDVDAIEAVIRDYLKDLTAHAMV